MEADTTLILTPPTHPACSPGATLHPGKPAETKPCAHRPFSLLNLGCPHLGR